MNITGINCSRSALERFPPHCEQYVLARSVKDIAIHTDSSSLRGASKTWQFIRTLRHCEEQSNEAILAGFSSLRGAKQRSNLGWLPVLARRDSTVAICAGFPSLRAKRSNLVSRKGLLHPFGVRNDEYHQSPRRVQAPLVLARNVSDTAILSSKKGLLHPFGVRNDGSIQESRDINRSNRNSHSFLDIIESLKKMNLFLLSQR